MRRCSQTRVFTTKLLKAIVAVCLLRFVPGQIAQPGQPAQQPAQPLLVRLGASLSLSGSSSAHGIEARRCLELLQSAVNNQSILTTGGRPVHLELLFKDDESIMHRMRANYKNLSKNPDSMLLVGPSDNRFVEDALAISNQSGRVMVSFTAVDSSYYAGRSSYSFSVGPLQHHLYGSSLALLQQRGARTLISISLDSIVGDELCQKGVAYAKQLGYVNLYSINSINLQASHLHDAMRTTMDVIMLCGQPVNIAKMLFYMHAQNVNPSATLFIGPTSQEVSTAVGTPLANQLIGFTSWSPSLDTGACPVFGTAQNFLARYTHTFGSIPTDSCARAAAAGLALVLAVRQSDSLDHDLVRGALAALDVDSFYGQVNFAENGTLLGMHGSPFQLRRKLTDTNTSLFEHLLNSSHQPVYPMGSWVERALEVYPCKLGYELHPNTGVCTICSPGRYRSATQTVCRTCEMGFYSIKEGSGTCYSCPSGATCHLGLSDHPPAAAGWYAINLSGVPRYVRCRPSSVCLGANHCAWPNVGKFCARCAASYTNSGKSIFGSTHECTVCPRWYTLSLGIVVVLFFDVVFITLIARWAWKAAYTFRSTSTIIIKISVHQVWLVSAISVSYASSMVSSPWQNASDALSDHFHAYIMFDCFNSDLSWRSYQMQVVSAFLIIPGIALVSSLSVIACCKLRHHARQKLATWLARSRPKSLNSLRSRLAVFLASQFAQCLQVVLAPDAHALHGDGWPHWSHSGRSVEFQLFDLLPHCARQVLVWTYFLYPVTIRMFSDAFDCEVFEHKMLLLRVDKTVECYGTEHLPWFALAFLGFLMFGFGVPLLLLYSLLRLQPKLWHIKERCIFGFFYNGYKPEWYWFEALRMLRLPLVHLCVFFGSDVMKASYLVILSFTCLLFHVRAQPYDIRDFWIFARIESLGLLGLFIRTLATFMTIATAKKVNLMSMTSISWKMLGSQSVNLFIFFLQLVALVCYGFFLLYSFWGILRAYVKGHLYFKERCVPQFLTLTERIVLLLVPKINTLEVDQVTHELVLSRLRHGEVVFLKSMLYNLMKYYMHTEWPLHPGRMITALREAVVRTIRYRQSRARQIHRRMLLDKRINLQWIKHKLDGIHAPRKSPSNLTSSGDVELQNDIVGQRVLRTHSGDVKQLLFALGDHDVGVEELQNAMMLLEKPICDHEPVFGVIDEVIPPDAEEDPSLYMAGMLRGTESQIDEQDSHDDLHADANSMVAEVLAAAGSPVRVEDKTIQRQCEKITAEVVRLRAQILCLNKQAAKQGIQVEA